MYYFLFFFFFFFNDTATTEIYTLSLHDALPISWPAPPAPSRPARTHETTPCQPRRAEVERDRKSTRLNSSHANISYAVFCLKKKKKKKTKKNKKKKTQIKTKDYDSATNRRRITK